MRQRLYKILPLVLVLLILAYSVIRCSLGTPEEPAQTTDEQPAIEGTFVPDPSPPQKPETSATPAASPSPEPELTPSPEPPPHPATLFAPRSVEETDPSAAKYKFQYDIMARGEIVSEYRRADDIFLGIPEEYTELEGITTFRGNNFRNNPSWGTVNIKNNTLTKVWSIGIGGNAKWGLTGVGWNGQPAIIRWDEETRRIMNINQEKKDKEGLVEVIYGAMDGVVRFLDIDDGKPTRASITLGAPIKGSVTIDPRGYPLMYVGEGAYNDKPLGFHIYSLIDGKELMFLNGADPFANRFWRSFDGNILVDSKNDTLIVPAENGILYTIKLGTQYDKAAGTISIEPEIVKYRYKTPMSPELGIENSVTAFSHYAMFADSSGLVHCFDLNTMTPVWIRHCTDDTDSTILLDLEEDSSLSLYTACAVDKQGSGGRSYIRKLNAETGELFWEHSYPCAYDSNVNGGALASPILGKGDIEGGVIYFIGKVQTGQGGGVLVNLDKETGKIIWETYLPRYGWSSPVDIYTAEGKSYIIVCDASGAMFLIDGKTGTVLGQTSLGSNVEGSPAIFDNKIVVGTRGQQIFCVEIG